MLGVYLQTDYSVMINTVLAEMRSHKPVLTWRNILVNWGTGNPVCPTACSEGNLCAQNGSMKFRSSPEARFKVEHDILSLSVIRVRTLEARSIVNQRQNYFRGQLIVLLSPMWRHSKDQCMLHGIPTTLVIVTQNQYQERRHFLFLKGSWFTKPFLWRAWSLLLLMLVRL